jgi:6-phosphogluconolactonase/glucosamine-6-phosphate isomerase/deaminase
VIAQDRIGLGSYAGRVAGETLRAALQQRPTARLVVATGSSQFEVLEALIKEQGIEWSRVEAFHLDEYIGLSIDHPASFCGYLRQRFVDRVQGNESRGLKDFTMSMSDAKALHADLTRLLIELQALREQAASQPKEEVITVEVGGGAF